MRIAFMNDGKLLVEDARVMVNKFRNFSGEKDGRYDQPGKRYYHIVIDDPVLAQKMTARNWPVKILPEYGDSPAQNIMKVSVNPDNPYFRCGIFIDNRGSITRLDPEEFKLLDGATIIGCRLTLRLYEYNPGSFSAQNEEGIFSIQPLSYWEDQFAQEEYPWE